MKIENIRKGEWGKVRAFFDVASDEGFVMKGFKLIEGINGLFASMPSRKGTDEQGNDKYYDIVWVESKSLRDELSQMAIAEYQKDSNNPMQPPKANKNTEEPEMVGSNISSKTAEKSVEETPSATPNEAFSDDDIPF